MFGKIIHFRREQGAAQGAAEAVTPDKLTSDNPFVEELLEQEGAAEGDRVPPKVPPLEAVRLFLDIAMAEIVQVYALAERDPPRKMKLVTLFKRYDQLRPSMRWPRLNPDQLSKQLCLNACRSHRVGKQKVRMIELPTYPAAQFK